MRNHLVNQIEFLGPISKDQSDCKVVSTQISQHVLSGQVVIVSRLHYSYKRGRYPKKFQLIACLTVVESGWDLGTRLAEIQV